MGSQCATGNICIEVLLCVRHFIYIFIQSLEQLLDFAESGKSQELTNGLQISDPTTYLLCHTSLF